MRELKDFIVVISWWGQAHLENSHDGEGKNTDALVPSILAAAEEFGTQIAFHIEPYEGGVDYFRICILLIGRNASTVKSDLIYLVREYGHSPSFYRDPKRNNRPHVYLYDSYHTPPEEWQTVFGIRTAESIRGTENDFVVLGLITDEKSQNDVLNSHFDGAYTYFGAEVGFLKSASF